MSYHNTVLLQHLQVEEIAVEEIAAVAAVAVRVVQHQDKLN
jgi:hypothetical protein